MIEYSGQLENGEGGDGEGGDGEGGEGEGGEGEGLIGKLCYIVFFFNTHLYTQCHDIVRM